MLRGTLLNAYGWWTVSTIALYAGIVMVAAGIILGILAFFGFRHARRAAKKEVAAATTTTVVTQDRVTQDA